MSGPGAHEARLASASQKPARLKKRADFLRTAAGRRWHERAFTLQARPRADSPASGSARVGFTLTKKVGNAVVRNRARRRLREAIRLGDLPLRSDHDYVLIGRLDACRLAFAEIGTELRRAVDAVHRVPAGGSDSVAPRGPRRGKNRRPAINKDTIAPSAPTENLRPKP